MPEMELTKPSVRALLPPPLCQRASPPHATYANGRLAGWPPQKWQSSQRGGPGGAGGPGGLGIYQRPAHHCVARGRSGQPAPRPAPPCPAGPSGRGLSHFGVTNEDVADDYTTRLIGAPAGPTRRPPGAHQAPIIHHTNRRFERCGLGCWNANTPGRTLAWRRALEPGRQKIYELAALAAPRGATIEIVPPSADPETLPMRCPVSLRK